jgi:hypothetical protein
MTAGSRDNWQKMEDQCDGDSRGEKGAEAEENHHIAQPLRTEKC